MDVDLRLGLAVLELERDFLLLDRVEKVVEIRCGHLLNPATLAR